MRFLERLDDGHKVEWIVACTEGDVNKAMLVTDADNDVGAWPIRAEVTSGGIVLAHG
jgi:hypothetical protein